MPGAKTSLSHSSRMLFHLDQVLGAIGDTLVCVNS